MDLIVQLSLYANRTAMIAMGLAIMVGPSLAAANTPPFTPTTMPESSGTYPAGFTAYNTITSQTADPLGPFRGQSVWFRGYLTSGSSEVVNGAHLVYRFQLPFNQPVSINSVTVTGTGDYYSGGNAAVLRLLDQNRSVLATLSTTNLPSGPISTYTLNGNGAQGQTFFIDEFDYSTNGRYRSQITIDASPAGCQVNVNKFGQADGYPGYWGGTEYAFHTGKTLRSLGCATSTLSMALDSAGVHSIPLGLSALLQCSAAGTGLQQTNPGTLNCFMVQHGSGVDYDFNNDVQFEITTLDVSFVTTLPMTGKAAYFDDSLTGLNSLFTPSQATTALKGAVCDGHAVVVKVAPIASCQIQSAPPGGHYVLVTSEQDDSNGNPTFGIVDPGCATIKNLDAYSNRFEIRGFVADPTNVSTLEVLTGDNADILVTDALGHRAGSDGGTVIYKEIPRSSYSQDFLTDNDTGQQATGVTHSVNVFQPAEGAYGITVTGLKLGTYTLVVERFSADGTPQPGVQVIGIAGVGSQTSFQIGFSNSATTGIIPRATFASTLADINNSLQLGLIDNAGIANSLSQKIQAARDATGPARNNILNAFKNEVNAQAGKHITGMAPQVLLQDADSLISQNQ